MQTIGMAVTPERHGITVHALSPGHPWGPVFYACLSREIENPPGHGTNRSSARHRLISILWEHLVTSENSPWECEVASTRAAAPIQVLRDSLGKPHLLVGEERGPAISFSNGGGRVWAALCTDQSDIGIDVAAPDEFPGDYPLHRVFHTQELQHGVRLTAGNVAQAAALLWSVKEAVVKALGCGFHFIEPRDLCVQPCAEEDGPYTFPIRLSTKARERLPLSAARSLWVRAVPQAQMWLSIALLSGPRDSADVREYSHVPADRNVD